MMSEAARLLVKARKQNAQAKWVARFGIVASLIQMASAYLAGIPVFMVIGVIFGTLLANLYERNKRLAKIQDLLVVHIFLLDVKLLCGMPDMPVGIILDVALRMCPRITNAEAEVRE